MNPQQQEPPDAHDAASTEVPNFDTHKAVKNLAANGLEVQAAGAIVDTMVWSQRHLATKADVERLVTKIVTRAVTEIRAEIRELRQDVDKKFESMYRYVLLVAGSMVALGGTIVAVVEYIGR